jgi:hypothetical protein
MTTFPLALPTPLPRAQLLKRGERLLEPDVYVTRVDDMPAVVKDYSRYRRTPLAPLRACWSAARRGSCAACVAGRMRRCCWASPAAWP